MKRKMSVRRKIEICEIIAFIGIMGMFLAGFGAWIFEVRTAPIFYISAAVFFIAGWKGGIFSSYIKIPKKEAKQ